VSHRVRAIHDRDEAMLPGHSSELTNRKKLSGLVRDVTEMQHLGLRRNGSLEPLEKIALCGWAWEIDTRDFDLVAARLLIPGCQHAGVILLGHDDFIAGLQVDAVLRNLQRLTCIS